MTRSNAPDDPLLSEHLLHKADALIRRNRPGGVGSDAEEIPVLVEAIDDLPELTDEIEPEPDSIVTITLTQPGAMQQFAAATQLNAFVEPFTAPPTPSAPPLRTPPPLPPARPGLTRPIPPSASTAPAPDQAAAIREAVERSRRELMQEMLVEQERAIAEAVERVRAEQKAMHARAMQAAYAQGKEEAEINHWPALQEARKEAIQSAAMSMSEHLITLDAYIAQAIESWLAKELPQIISGEIDAFVNRLRQQTTSHMRATLLPDLSEKLSSILDEALKNNGND